MTGGLTTRGPTAVVAAATTVAAVAAVPVALLIVLGPSFGHALRHGASLGQAWEAAAPTTDDWEVLPVFLVGAVVLGLVVPVASAVVWLLIMMSRRSAPLAHAGATVTAAGIPLLLLAFVNWNLAVSVAVPGAVIALVATPRVGRASQQPGRTAG